VKIFVAGYFGFANAGDEAILSSLLAQLRGGNPSVEITVSSGDPASTAREHGVRAVARNNIQAIDRAIVSADLVLVGGGGLFQDYWGADPDTLLSDEHWGLSYWTGCALLGALHGKPVMLCAVGVGPIESEQGARLTRAACEAATAITVRDQGSKAVLVRIGVPAEKVMVTADLAFAFSPGEVESLPLPKPPVVAVAVRPWSIGVHPDFLEREIASALDIFVEQTGGSALLLPFQQIEGELEDDRAIARRIVAKMRFASQAVVSEGLSASGIYRVIERSDAVLAMRLHALLFAAMCGVPAVAISYDPKVDSTLALLAGEPALAVGSLEARVLARRMLDAIHSKPAAAGRTLAVLRSLAIQNCSLAIRLAESTPGERTFSSGTLELMRRSAFGHIRRTQSVERELAASEKRIGDFDRENILLRDQIRELEEGLGVTQTAAAKLEAENRSLGESLQELGMHFQKVDAEKLDFIARLNLAEASRFATVCDFDRYRAAFQSALEAVRTQRAWQLMLLMNKAYTLLFRGGAAKFLRWALGVPFRGAGSLAEFEPRFPDLAGYVPDSFRFAKWLPELEEVKSREVQGHLHPPQRGRFDVVILAIIDFDFRFQRPQQIASEMARRGNRVFWVSPSRFHPPASAAPFVVLPLRENLWEVHLRTPAVDIYMGELKAEPVAAMTEAFDALVKEWGIGENVVLAQLPFWRKLGLAMREAHGSVLIYDCMDDWETFENMGAFNVSEEKAFVREADILVVTGAELAVKFEEQGLDPVLIRNGADYDFFAKAGPSDLLQDVPRPVIGYFGAIADWIDLDLVYEVAQLRPQYSFVLIGQVFGRDTSKLEALANVRLLGSKPYSDIPAYLYHFDACTIPFLLNQVTKATDPVKLYEYFSLGKPVVATDMKELGQCGDLLYIGRGAEDFAGHLDKALGEESSLAERRVEFAKTNTWKARVDQLEEAVRGASPLVSILIVTHNSEEFVRPCLDSILRNTAYPAYEVILVDNASTDGTVRLLRDYPNFRLVELGENTGFAAGNNRAAAEAKGSHLIFLNVDTMVTPGWVHLLLEHVRHDPAIGLICPVTNFAGNEAKLNVSYRDADGMEVFAAERTRAQRGKDSDIRVAAFFCALVPKAVWDRVGELDVTFGMGMFEDDDFAMRVRDAGWRVAVAEDCFIHHFGQGSFSKISRQVYERVFEENRRRFEEKWQQAWEPHRLRAGVRPPFEEKRFTPAEFMGSG
jgi:polysaccharide pyruvyl transferase CsaB